MAGSTGWANGRPSAGRPAQRSAENSRRPPQPVAPVLYVRGGGKPQSRISRVRPALPGSSSAAPTMAPGVQPMTTTAFALRICSAGLALAGLALAQLPDNLIGLTRATPLLNQRDHNACAPLPFCVPPGFPPAPVQPYAGGTGWDPMRN